MENVENWLNESNELLWATQIFIKLYNTIIASLSKIKLNYTRHSNDKQIFDP